MVESAMKCRRATSTSCLVRHRISELIRANGTEGLNHSDEGGCKLALNRIDYWRCFIIVAAEVYRRLCCRFFDMVVTCSMLCVEWELGKQPLTNNCWWSQIWHKWEPIFYVGIGNIKEDLATNPIARKQVDPEWNWCVTFRHLPLQKVENLLSPPGYFEVR